MPYYKDDLTGKFPIFSHVPLNDPRFVEITEAEWNVLRQAGNTEDHPYSPYVLNRDLMAAAARDHIPPAGTVMPDSPPPEQPAPAGPVQGVIEESK